jgi:spore coat protein A
MIRKNTISVLSLMLMVALVLMAGLVEAQVNVNQLPINPKSIPQFVDPLPHFAGLRVDAKSGGNLTVQMVPHQQIALSTGTPVTGGVIGAVGTPATLGMANLWVYQISNDGGATFTPKLWPAFTIEANRGNPLTVTYINDLGGQTYANVNLIADQTLHWADPLMAHMDPAADLFSPYGGAIPTVVHLHGGEVPSESDGGPDAWFTTAEGLTGPAWGIDGTDNVYNYANTQEEATLWFHDHALGVTRLNVYAGLAGFYFLRGPEEEALQLPGWSGDDLVQEVAPVGASGTFNANPYLPELEVVIQDRMFDTNGGLYFPNLPPNPLDHPFWTPEFVGDIITVNGKTWPYISVAPRKYRIRLLNGSNARFYELWLQDLATGTMGPVINQIGTDGGLLDAPVAIGPPPATMPKLIMGPGERADVVIDFASVANPNLAGPAVWTLKNSGNTPYPKGGPPMGATLGRIMQFVVNGVMVDGPDVNNVGDDASLLPNPLRSIPLIKLSNFAGGTTVTPDTLRQLTLNEVMAMGGPLEVLVNNTKWDGNGMGVPGLGETEIPREGNTEVWQIINITADAHPIHLHLVQFQLVSRQKLNLNKYLKTYNAAFTGGVFNGAAGPPLPYNTANADGAFGGNPAITPFLQGMVKPANANERGWKDTFIMYPGEVTTVVVRWAPTDLPTDTPPENLLFAFDPSMGPGYVWHCHIIDHEDNEMMRPYAVLPNKSRLVPAPFAKNSTSDQSVIELGDNLPTVYSLSQNYPNPFNPTTKISFTLPEAKHVTLKVYNSRGQAVSTLIDEEAPAGYHTAMLDAAELATGMYFYKLVAGSFVQTKKMLLIK